MSAADENHTKYWMSKTVEKTKRLSSAQVEERARRAQELIDFRSFLCSESRRKRALCAF